MTMTGRHEAGEGHGAALERSGAAERPLLDLTEDDPARCGLGWDPTALGDLLGEARAPTDGPGPRPHGRARDAVAGYLAGRGAAVAPDHIRLARSSEDALRLALTMVSGDGGEVLIPLPGDPAIERLAMAAGADVTRYPLAYDGAWRLDRKALARRFGPRTRAIVLGNPSVPAGAMPSHADLAAIEALCAERAVVLVADEAFIDTALAPAVSVLEATHGLAVHVSGLSGVCGVREVGCEWLAISGPEHLVAPALERLDGELSAAGPAVGPRRPDAVPALLARREVFLRGLRTRLSGNRAALATAALREAPWSLCWGRGGCWGVLRIGAGEPDDALCRALREEGVAVHPGSRYGLGGDEHLVLSLLPPPDVFHAALARLDRHLRAAPGG
jgi:aspartate/methionine/tyrosine aminotransferase